jgi:translation initiation factor 3 subunit B
VFRLRDKGVPVEVLDFKERVHDVKWEPLGSRLAVVIGEGPRYSVVFYTMGDKVRLLLCAAERL